MFENIFEKKKKLDGMECSYMSWTGKKRGKDGGDR